MRGYYTGFLDNFFREATGMNEREEEREEEEWEEEEEEEE